VGVGQRKRKKKKVGEKKSSNDDCAICQPATLSLLQRVSQNKIQKPFYIFPSPIKVAAHNIPSMAKHDRNAHQYVGTVGRTGM